MYRPSKVLLRLAGLEHESLISQHLSCLGRTTSALQLKSESYVLIISAALKEKRREERSEIAMRSQKIATTKAPRAATFSEIFLFPGRTRQKVHETRRSQNIKFILIDDKVEREK